MAKDLGTKFFIRLKSKFERFVEADVVVSINFINVIPKSSFIGKFRFGVINAHAGDLPKYRGNACPNWAILNDEWLFFRSIRWIRTRQWGYN